MKKTRPDSKTKTRFVLIALAVCLGLLSTAQAINPTPDGGYPGGNTAEGQNALLALTTGGYNTAVGYLSLRSNATNALNTAIGAGALFANTGDKNTASGAGALLSNATGHDNNANGVFALFSNNTGSFNNAFGGGALFSNTTGVQNDAFGDTALWSNQTGSSNTAIGDSAGFSITGTNNVCIGAAVYGMAGENATVRIADNLPTAAGLSACYIGGIAGQTVDPSGAGQVYIDNSGKLGVFLSSQRFKQDIQPMGSASEAILALKPVIFHYKNDAKNTPCFGLIAEQAALVDPDLVVRNKNGELLTVRYDQVNVMLLNEFLKEHQKVEAQESRIEKQETTIAQLQTVIETIVVHSKEQDPEIQKVRDQMQMSRSDAQLAIAKH